MILDGVLERIEKFEKLFLCGGDCLLVSVCSQFVFRVLCNNIVSNSSKDNDNTKRYMQFE